MSKTCHNCGENNVDYDVVRLLKQRPYSHSELADELDIEWHELQESIRRLRNQSTVRIRIDRRYELDNTTKREPVRKNQVP